MENLILKPISYRALKNGQWALLADGSEFLVIEKNTLKEILAFIEKKEELNDELVKLLTDEGFTTEEANYLETVIEEGKSTNWKLLHIILYTTGVVSISSLLVSLIFIGIQNPINVIPLNVSALITIPFAILFLLISAGIHELMHVIYGRTYNKVGSISLKVRKATATVSLTHVWLWSLKSRLAALSAGLVWDFLLLAILMQVQVFFNHWALSLSGYLLWVRVFWQFRFHKNSDGRLIAMNLIDNPLIEEDSKDEQKNNNDVVLWKKLKIIGYLIEGLVLVLLVLPFIGIFVRWLT